MRKPAFPAFLVVPLALGGCVGPAYNIPSTEARQNLHFDGQPYSLNLRGGLVHDKGPSGGLSGEAGRVTGVLCGTDLELSATYRGDHLDVAGFLENQYPAGLEIREVGAEPGVKGYLRITGSVAYHSVQLELFGDRLAGWVGHCRYDLRLRPDAQSGEPMLQQLVQARGFDVRMRMSGVDALWKLPAAVQAASLPLMLMCLQAKVFENLGQEPPLLSFAGPATAVPPKTLTFVSQNTYCR